MSTEEITVSNLLTKIQQGWDDFHAYLQKLTPEQMTQPTDDVGWTVKDHLAHLAVWEDGIAALLRKQSRREHVGLSEAQWASNDFDAQNAVIRDQHKHKSLDEVMRMLADAHQRLVEVVQSLTDADIRRPYGYYAGNPAAEESPENAVFWAVAGDSYDHYKEHQPWIDTIVKGK